MKRRTIQVSCTSTKQWVQIVAPLFSRSKSLTDKEIEVLGVLVELSIETKGTLVGPLSTESRKVARTRLSKGIDLGTYVKRLKDKGAIRLSSSCPGGYDIHPLFVPGPAEQNEEIVIRVKHL